MRTICIFVEEEENEEEGAEGIEGDNFIERGYPRGYQSGSFARLKQMITII